MAGAGYVVVNRAVGEAQRYVCAPHGTEAKDLGNRDIIEDLGQAMDRAHPQGLAVFSVTVIVAQVTRPVG